MGMMDLCVFGDSIGKGIVLQPESSRYESIKMNLDKLFGRNDITVKNYSMASMCRPVTNGQKK